jgi:ABC-type glycerol-3-phosphate transport system substrate-binding protein
MSVLRFFILVAAIAGLTACGGPAGDTPTEEAGSAGQAKPTAVFSDSFETGEPEKWQAEETESEAPEEAEAESPTPTQPQ